MEIKPFGGGDVDALQAFLERIPTGESAFFKEDVTSPDAAARWLDGPADIQRYVAVEDGSVVGFTALVPGAGWSSHVSEVRVVVDPARRGTGVGTALSRQALVAAIESGARKLVVEVVADQEPAIEMFKHLGFAPEAILADHVRDRNGEYHDLMILAHDVEGVRSSLATIGITEEVGGASP